MGNIVVAGFMTGPADFGCGTLMASGDGMFVAKLDPCGACLWSRSFPNGLEAGTATYGMTVGGLAVDVSNSILVTGGFFEALDLGGIVLTGSHADEPALRRQARRAGGPLVGRRRHGRRRQLRAEASGIAVDSDENVYVTGYYSVGR